MKKKFFFQKIVTAATTLAVTLAVTFCANDRFAVTISFKLTALPPPQIGGNVFPLPYMRLILGPGEIREVSVTAVTSEKCKSSYIIIKDFEHRGCHSENAKICINGAKMHEITSKNFYLYVTHWFIFKYSAGIYLFSIIGPKIALFWSNYDKN